MKRAMIQTLKRTMKQALIVLSAALMTALTISGCREVPVDETAFGTVIVSIDGVTKTPAPRTLLPAVPEAGALRYGLTFTRSGYDPVTVADWDGSNGITLAAGGWSLAVDAYLMPGHESVGAKAGVAVNVAAGTVSTVTVILEPITGTGAGSFQYTLILPEGVTAATMSLVSDPAPKPDDPPAVDLLANGEGNTFTNNKASGTITGVDAGYYILTVALTGAEAGGVTKSVHIYGNLATVYSAAFDGSLVTPAPAAPMGLTAAQVPPVYKKIAVSWTAVDGANGYRVYWGETDDPAQSDQYGPTIAAGTTSCEIPVPEFGRTYHVWVKAANDTGDSPWSLAASAAANPVTIVWGGGHTREAYENYLADGNSNKFEWIWTARKAFEDTYGEGSVVVIPENGGWRETIGRQPTDLSLGAHDLILSYLGADILQDISPYFDLNIANVSEDANHLLRTPDGLLWGPTESYHFNDGKFYAAGFQAEDVTVMWYNEDMFTANGRQTPRQLFEAGNWNWETFEEAAKALTTDNDHPGFATHWNSKPWVAFLASNGVRFFTPGNFDPTAGTYDIIPGFINADNSADQKAKDTLEFLRTRWATGGGNKIIYETDWMAAFDNGKAAMALPGTTNWNWVPVNGGKVAPLPAGSADFTARRGISGNAMKPESFVMPRSGLNSAGAVAFVKAALALWEERVYPVMDDNARWRWVAASRSVNPSYQDFAGMGVGYRDAQNDTPWSVLITEWIWNYDNPGAKMTLDELLVTGKTGVKWFMWQDETAGIPSLASLLRTGFAGSCNGNDLNFGRNPHSFP